MSTQPAWAHTSGLLDLNPVPQLTDEMIPARLAMADRMSRYAWAFDERDPDLLAECFTDEASWEASIRGEERIGPFLGRRAVVDVMTGRWEQQPDQRRHMITNHLVRDVTPSSATIHTYLLLVSTATGVIPLTCGFYRVGMVRESDGVWRIRTLLAGFDVPF